MEKMYSYVFKHTCCNWLFAVIKTNLEMRLTFSGNNMYNKPRIFVFTFRVQLKIMLGLLKFRVPGGKVWYRHMLYSNINSNKWHSHTLIVNYCHLYWKLYYMYLGREMLFSPLLRHTNLTNNNFNDQCIDIVMWRTNYLVNLFPY
jgi:hypothetical protein